MALAARAAAATSNPGLRSNPTATLQMPTRTPRRRRTRTLRPKEELWLPRVAEQLQPDRVLRPSRARCFLALPVAASPAVPVAAAGSVCLGRYARDPGGSRAAGPHPFLTSHARFVCEREIWAKMEISWRNAMADEGRDVPMLFSLRVTVGGHDPFRFRCCSNFNRACMRFVAYFLPDIMTPSPDSVKREAFSTSSAGNPRARGRRGRAGASPNPTQIVRVTRFPPSLLSSRLHKNLPSVHSTVTTNESTERTTH